ncbi:HK97 family phage prohead protease [bacterium]|nr:HK97 family phage prohead protease [bacterium]MDB4464516.1 HK97 family phage prohead protease [bacterium]
MDKMFNLTSTFKSHEADDGSVMIRGMASTADFDRAGDSISIEAWQKGGLKNFEKNPIILFNHDYNRPIGRATGLKAGPNGLELECKISKNAPGNVAELVKDGVLGAFSVGFKVKDADYLKETDGLMIKDAELFEVSVVSVPCNQAATFSLAKSFDSSTEYEEFKKTFTNRVDLAGQSLAKDEVNTSNVASDHTPKSAELISADQEIKMDNQNIDLEAFAKKVAEDTAAKIAMKQAEQKAAEKAEAEKQAALVEAQNIKVKTGIQSGVETLVADMEAKMASKDADIADILAKHKADLDEKAVEIAAMQNSKKSFGRGDGDLSKFGKDFLHATVLGKVTGKGMDTKFGQDLLNKAGVQFDTNAGTIDTIVSSTFEEEVRLSQKVAGLFKEMQVNSGATVLPLMDDTNMATFSGEGIGNGILENRTQVAANEFELREVTALAKRLISGTYIGADTDEQVVVTILPMILSALARAHARAIDGAFTVGNASIAGLVGGAGTDGAGSFLAGDSTTVTDLAVNGSANLTATMLMSARGEMGKYGINPADVAYIVNVEEYYNLVNDPAFADISEVGNDLAAKVTGAMGSVYGSPVVVCDQFARGANKTAAVAVNVNNYVVPRLKGVSIESEYETANQRTAIVAAQSLGFTELFAGATGDLPSVRIEYAAS